jgi:hypothetical protein
MEGKVSLTDLPISNQRLLLTSQNAQKQLQTTSSGRFGSFVPQTSKLLIEVKGRDNQNIFQQEIDQNKFGEKVEIDLPSEVSASNFLSSKFEVIDCNGEIKEQKVISVNYASGTSERFALYRSENSLMPLADEQFSVRSGDGPAFEWNELTNNIYFLSECKEHQNGFAVIKIRNDQKLFSAFDEERTGGRTVLNAEQDEVRLIVEADSKGVYGNDLVNIRIEDVSFGDQGYFVSCENAMQGCGIEVCEITHYKDDGDEWNRVYFKGKLWMQTISPPQAGNFEVEGYILSKQ